MSNTPKTPKTPKEPSKFSQFMNSDGTKIGIQAIHSIASNVPSLDKNINDLFEGDINEYSLLCRTCCFTQLIRTIT